MKSLLKHVVGVSGAWPGWACGRLFATSLWKVESDEAFCGACQLHTARRRRRRKMTKGLTYAVKAIAEQKQKREKEGGEGAGCHINSLQIKASKEIEK